MFDWYKMLIKSLIYLFWVHSITGSLVDGCGQLSFSNSTFTFFVQETGLLTLNVSSVSQPFYVHLQSDWERLHFLTNDFLVSDEGAVEIELTTDMHYLYKVQAYCAQTSGDNILLAETSVAVAKSSEDSTLQKNFGIFMSVFVMFAMFLMGCDLDYMIIFNYLKRPVGPAIGIVAQFIGMPVSSYIIGYIFLRDQPFAQFGLLLVGCSPGGSASNFWTVLYKGDVNLSVTMTFCSSIASFGLSTLWIWALGKQILDTSVEMPYLRILGTIVSLIVPVCLGMFLKYKKPDIAHKAKRFSKPVFLLFILVSASLGIYINRAFFSLVEGRHALAAILLSVSGFIVGAVLAFVFRLNREQIIAVSIETAIQNPSAAFLVMQTNIPSPYGDIGSVPVICYLMFAIGPPMLVVLIIFKSILFIRDRRRNKSTEEKDTDLKKIENGGQTVEAAKPNQNAGNPDPKLTEVVNGQHQKYGAAENRGFQ